MKPDEATRLKPPEGAVRLRRFLDRASRKLILYSLPLIPLAFVLAIVVDAFWYTVLFFAVPFLCWSVALSMAVVRSIIPSFMQFSLGGLMALIWSAAGCITAIVAGGQNENGYYVVIAGLIGLSMWFTVVLFFVVYKEQRYEWPKD